MDTSTWHRVCLACPCGGKGVIVDVHFNVEGEIWVDGGCPFCGRVLGQHLKMMERVFACYEWDKLEALKKMECPSKKMH